MNIPIDELLATFNRWIETLPADAAVLREGAVDPAVPRAARRLLVGSLEYLPRQFDLVPDHLGEIGALDDAFVLRVGAMLALKAGIGDDNVDLDLKLQRLSADVQLIREFLGDAYLPFLAYVVRLPDLAVRGRDADRIIDDKDAQDAFLRDLRRDLEQHPTAAVRDAVALDQLRLFIKDKCNAALDAK